MTRKLKAEPIGNSNSCVLHEKSQKWWQVSLLPYLQARYADELGPPVMCHDCALTARRLVERSRDRAAAAAKPKLALVKG